MVPYGREYQLGDPTFWTEIPVDILGLHPRVTGDRAFGPEVRFEAHMESPAYMVAAATALLKAAALKQLAERQMSSNARHYYLATAKEFEETPGRKMPQ